MLVCTYNSSKFIYIVLYYENYIRRKVILSIYVSYHLLIEFNLELIIIQMNHMYVIDKSELIVVRTNLFINLLVETSSDC